MSVLAFAGPVAAQTPPSAVDQYVEDPPTAGGTTPKGNKPGGGGSGKLPPRAASAIQGAGKDAQLLTEIATSATYGAPTTSLGSKNAKNAKANGKGNGAGSTLRGGRGADAAAADPRTNVSAGDTITAAVSAVQGGDAARLVVLLLALAAITVGALATAGLRQRRRAV